MKFICVATALALSGASVATATIASSDCSYTQQLTSYTVLASVLTLNELGQCMDDAGISFLYMTSLPTDEQYLPMCQSTDCYTLIADILALTIPDCVLTIPTSGLGANVYEIAHGFADKCELILNPATEAPVTDTPVTDAPVTEDPVTNIPITEDPVTDIPITEDPITEDPVTEDPVTDAPVTLEPATDIPVTEQPATDSPTTDVPVVTTASPLCGW